MRLEGVVLVAERPAGGVDESGQPPGRAAPSVRLKTGAAIE